MTLRKELLERELNRLGFRKAEAARDSATVESAGSFPDKHSGHPQAEGESDSCHGS